MNRRDLLKMLGIGAIGAALPIAAKPVRSRTVAYTDKSVFVQNSNGRMYEIRDWQPCTAYNVGDRVQFSNGKIITVAMAGTSASVEMVNGTIVPLKGNF